MGIAAAATGSGATARGDWLDAARLGDEANHRELLKGLAGHLKAEGHLPAGAGGGVDRR